jgi:hypothetical protein
VSAASTRGWLQGYMMFHGVPVSSSHNSNDVDNYVVPGNNGSLNFRYTQSEHGNTSLLMCDSIYGPYKTYADVPRPLLEKMYPEEYYHTGSSELPNGDMTVKNVFSEQEILFHTRYNESEFDLSIHKDAEYNKLIGWYIVYEQ